MTGTFKTAVVVPPLYSTAYPQMGPPVLKGYLAKRGLRLDQFDLNVSFFEHLKKKVSLETVSNEGDQQRPREVEDLLLMYFADRLARKLCEQGGFPGPRLPGGAASSVEQYNPEVGSGLGYLEIVNSSHDTIAEFAAHRGANYYHTYLEETGAHLELATGYDLVGLSVTGPSQFIAALAIAGRIKEANPDTRVVLGGPWATMFASELAGATVLHRFYDFVICGEGERPLLGLIEGLDGGDLSHVPNLWICDGVEPSAPSLMVRAEPEDFGPPDYDGLDLDAYRAPRPVLVQASRGCYWGRCAFCVHAAGVHSFDGRTRTRTVEEIVREVETLIERHSPGFLCFADVSLPPKILRGVSEAFVERGYRIPWYAFLRFEKAFDRSLLELARRAGCFLLHFGLESGSEAVLRRVDKGQDLQVARRILDDATDLGFRVTVHTMAGLPGETEQDLQETIRLLGEYIPRVHDSFTEIFRLERDTRIHRDPARYGIEIRSGGRVFDSSIPFDNPGGLSQEQALEIVNRELYGFYDGRGDLIYRHRSLLALKQRGSFAEPSVFRGGFNATVAAKSYEDSVEVSTTGGGILQKV